MATRGEMLRELRRVIEAAPEDRLHMGNYCESTECGTAYCAAGWASVDPWFRRNTTIGEVLRDRGDGFVYAIPGILGGGNETGYQLAKVFGLDAEECLYLFGIAGIDGIIEDLMDDPRAITKAMVLDNIARLERGEPAVPYDEMAVVAD